MSSHASHNTTLGVRMNPVQCSIGSVQKLTVKPIFRGKNGHCLTAVARRIPIDIAPRYLSGVLRIEHDSVRP
jgi:hypothetical protein